MDHRYIAWDSNICLALLLFDALSRLYYLLVFINPKHLSCKAQIFIFLKVCAHILFTKRILFSGNPYMDWPDGTSLGMVHRLLGTIYLFLVNTDITSPIVEVPVSRAVLSEDYNWEDIV
jgi:hypothetical protein